MSDDLTIPEKMSGYELARRVLDHPSGGVEELLKLSGNGESDWLELKAGMCLLPEDRAILLHNHPELQGKFSGSQAGPFSPSASGRDFPPTPCSTVPEPRDS